jgi:hypothetical protein
VQIRGDVANREKSLLLHLKECAKISFEQHKENFLIFFNCTVLLSLKFLIAVLFSSLLNIYRAKMVHKVECSVSANHAIPFNVKIDSFFASCSRNKVKSL